MHAHHSIAPIACLQSRHVCELLVGLLYSSTLLAPTHDHHDDDDRSSCDIVDGIAGAERAGTNKNTAIVTTQHVCSVERARERERFWKDVATGWLRTVSSCFQRRCSQIRSTVRSFRAAESPALCTTVCATIHGPWHTSAARQISRAQIATHGHTYDHVIWSRCHGWEATTPSILDLV